MILLPVVQISRRHWMAPTGRTITLTDPVTIGHIELTNWTSEQWIITGSTLTLSTSSVKPTITHPTLDSLRISSLIAGTSGFEKAGSGRLYLTNASKG